MIDQNIKDQWNDFPMGPKLRSWLELDQDAGTLDDNERNPPDDDRRRNFGIFIADALEKSTIDSKELLIDLVDELVTMDLPLAALKGVDAHPLVWTRDSFRATQAEGIAAMMSGDLGRAELCFKTAQHIAPNETAAVVNLGRILLHENRREEFFPWFIAGLDADPENYKLWELAVQYFQGESEVTPTDVARNLFAFAQERNSWAGLSLSAEMDPNHNSQSKVTVLQPFYAQGLRDAEFLIEYTGALGQSGDFSSIPGIVWQAEQRAGSETPWRLLIHGVQALLAQNSTQLFLDKAASIRKKYSLPVAVDHDLEQLMNEVREELQEESKDSTTTSKNTPVSNSKESETNL